MFSSIFQYIVSMFQQDDPTKVKSTPFDATEEDNNLRMIEDMTKRELDDLGNANGLHLDRRRKKTVMVAKLKEAGIHHG